VNCRETRDRLIRGASEDSGVQLHLGECGACGTFASRLELTRARLREHHAGVEPDAAFAGRVAARVREDSIELLGWAATRMLPVTLALAAVLAWFALGTSSASPDEVVQSPTDDLLIWVVEQEAGS
jgi:hypothetical protein